MRDFHDREAKADRKAGEVFEVSEERFKAINATRYGVLAEKAPAEEPKPKRTTRKKAEEE